MVPDLSLSDEPAGAQPFGVLWLKLAKKLVGTLAGRNGMEVWGCWVDRGRSPGKGVRVHWGIWAENTHEKNEENMLSIYEEVFVVVGGRACSRRRVCFTLAHRGVSAREPASAWQTNTDDEAADLPSGGGPFRVPFSRLVVDITMKKVLGDISATFHSRRFIENNTPRIFPHFRAQIANGERLRREPSSRSLIRLEQFITVAAPLTGQLFFTYCHFLDGTLYLASSF